VAEHCASNVISWPSSGNASRVWSINPDAWGFDKNLIGPTIYQPILFMGQYKDDETVALQDDHATVHRPEIVLNGFRSYDPWTGLYLQVDPLVDSTWNTYVYVNGNPVGRKDPSGLAINIGLSIHLFGLHWSVVETTPGLSCADINEFDEDPLECGFGGGGGGGGGAECRPGKNGAECPQNSCASSCCENEWFDCGQCSACKSACARQAITNCRILVFDETFTCCLSNEYDQCIKAVRPGETVSCNTRCDCFASGVLGAGQHCRRDACPPPTEPACVCGAASRSSGVPIQQITFGPVQ
jgi:RHS repeat-associated protein